MLLLDATILLISSKKQSAKGNENKTEANARQNWFYHKYLLNSLTYIVYFSYSHYENQFLHFYDFVAVNSLSLYKKMAMPFFVLLIKLA